MVYVKVIGGSFNGATGYVNKEYITREGEKSKRVDAYDQCFIVSGVQEYLPLRSNCFYDDEYEIRRLYNGDKVLLVENLGGDFWFVRDVNSGDVGYVSHKYLKKY